MEQIHFLEIQKSFEAISDIHNLKGDGFKELLEAYSKLIRSQEELEERYEKLEKIAYFDSLTGLPNWNMFAKKVNEHVEKKCLEKMALFFLDLDDFRNINTVVGYEYGDSLIINISRKLDKDLGEKCFLYRSGADELLILQIGFTDRKEIEETATQIMGVLNQPWKVAGREFFVSTSIGISIYPDDGRDLVHLLREAEIALNVVKSSKKNAFSFYEKSMYENLMRITEIKEELKNAIQNNEFSLQYQPQIDIKSKKIVSMEALLRWNNKKLGRVSPGEFIPIAEETGLIIPIGEWVLRAACIQNALWKKKGYTYDFIAINVSVAQLIAGNFFELVKSILDETGIKPEYLEIEITESVLMQAVNYNSSVLEKLKELGVRIALDDFGTGYSSLSYLMSLPVNTLKIDKCFIDGLCQDGNEELITSGIIELAHKMNLEVIAEGVEMETQFKALEGKNCNKIQGYYFGRPFDIEDVETILRREI